MLALLCFSGCRQSAPRVAVTPSTVAKTAVPKAPAAPRFQKIFVKSLPASYASAHIKPDEVGRIPILMYHAFGANNTFRGHRYDTFGLNIAPDTFRAQLDAMYKANWYPVNMRDVLSAHLDIPAGKTPVVLTFDDARGTQFKYLPDGTIDPNCAVGILMDFHAQHSDWPLRGTFYVLPKSKWNPAPFWQPGLETKKLRFLVDQGFELANHSTSHRMMGHLDGATLTWEMAECQRYFQARIPNLTMNTMALPGGDAPRNHALWTRLLSGKDGGTTYNNRCILMAWGGPTYGWASKKFDPERVARIGVSPGYMEGWLKRLSAAKAHEYVSDGDPNTLAVPQSESKNVNIKRLNGVRLLVYGDAVAKPLKPAAKMASAKAK